MTVRYLDRAAARRPNVEGLNLEAAGVELTARGAVRTDNHLRTSGPDIFAVGDVAGECSLLIFPWMITEL